MNDDKQPLSFELSQAADDAKLGLLNVSLDKIPVTGPGSLGGMLAVTTIVSARKGEADRDLALQAMRRCLRDRN